MALLRSYLFVPGNRDDFLRKAFAAGADAVVLDLEDGVPPEQKAAARDKVAEVIDRRQADAPPSVFVRINGLSGSSWQADLEAIVRPGLTGVRVPKSEDVDRIRKVDRTLDRLESQRGMESGIVELTLTIESARGVERATELARSTPRVKNLCFGAADFCADVMAEPSGSESETLYARSRIVIASRVARLQPPIASVYTTLDDDEGLRDSCEGARRLGYFGRSCLHPRQVPIVNAVFMPRPDEIARARRVVEASRQAAAEGHGTAMTDAREFVDPAVLRHAEAVLSIAARFNGEPA